MNPALIPTPDAIPVAWGWFQFLLLLTFPLHLLAMNSLVGGLAIGMIEHFKKGELNQKLAHRIAIALPLVIAFVVNLGVAPLLFLQVLYGHFVYTSSILMGVFWISIIPILIIGYYGAYLYDFKFKQLGRIGLWLAPFLLACFLVIGYFLSNNMLLMILPDSFAKYFSHEHGTYLTSSHAMFLPRYLHMMVGAVAVGGLFVGLLGSIWHKKDPELAAHAKNSGMRVFFIGTLINIVIGFWFLTSLSKDTMMIFMGQNGLATATLTVSMVATAIALWSAWKKKLFLTLSLTTGLVYLMAFMRAWIRSEYLKGVFQLGDLKVNPEYSPMVLFFILLLGAVVLMVWMLRQAIESFKHGEK